MIDRLETPWFAWCAALAALAAATFVPAPAGAAAVALAVALWLIRRPLPLAARGRRRAAALVGFAVAALIAAAVADLVAAARGGARAAGELQAGHEELWLDLERAADRASTALARVAAGAEERQQRFARLRAAAESEPDGELNLLLWDRYGDLQAWWGPGLLPDLAPAARRERERRVAQSVLSATLYVARRFQGADGEPWTLVAAESFSREGPPPVVARDRARWRGVPWSLEPQADASPARWVLRADPVARRAGGSRLLPRLARAALALLLLWIAAESAAAARGAHDGDASAPATAWLAGGVGALLLANGAGAPAAAVAALAAAILALAAALAWGRSKSWDGRVGGVAAIALGALIGPALLGAASRIAATERLVGELALSTPAIAVSRIAAVLAVLAAWAVAFHRGAARAPAAESPYALAAVGPAVAAALAALLADYPWPAAVALALAGGGIAAELARGRHRTRAGRLAVVFVAALVAAAAWSAGARQAEMERLSGVLSTLLPPAPARIASFAAAVERELAALDPAALVPSGTGDAVPEDLAFALWRRTSLARGDVLSSLAVVAPDGARSVFSSGLPIDAEGGLDRSPTRWIGLAPAAWLERRTGGESTRRDRRGRSWVLDWMAVPLPGFELAAAARHAGSVPGWPFEPAAAGALGGGRAVLYESGGRIVRSPWAEGTPPLDPAFASAAPFGRFVATPDGPARASARAGGGYTAAVFLPLATPLVALERAGSFLAGVLLPALAVAVALGLLAAPWSAIGGELTHAWRSYSTRLVLVFSAFLLLPVAVGSTWVAHAYARRLERQQEASARDALHSAQRILGEYVLSLEPGFGVGTAVDDRLLEWLARVVRSEVHLYWGSELYASSKRDLFAAGLQPVRLSGEIWQRIHFEGERIARRAARGAGREAVEIYAPLEIPGLAPEATKLVLALPRLAQQDELAAEVAAIRRRAFLTAAALALLLAIVGSVLARRFARPIEAIVRGTQRIAEGAPSLGFAPDELELVALATAIDRMAARVAEARERLLVEKRLVERIAENVTAAVVGLDGAGRVVFANRLARDRAHAVPGEPLRAGLAAAGLARVLGAFDAAARAAEPVATKIDLGAGERDWTLVRVPLPGPGEPSELVVIEDVTDVVRAQRLDAWAGMARIIAHEIKNPLTPIRLSAEHLREAWARDREHFEAVFERCTDNILRQVEELRQTASEFSLYSEIPRIDRRAGDLREAIGEVVEAYRAAPPAGVEIVFDAAGPRIEASFDRRLLGRAVRNLLENAMRASASRGRVAVELEQRADEVAVRVLDEGPGVPAEMVARVVEPYFSTQAGGTGLGLPIARRVAEEHGGSLTLRNRPSGGFEVTITIPRR